MGTTEVEYGMILWMSTDSELNLSHPRNTSLDLEYVLTLHNSVEIVNMKSNEWIRNI